MKIREIGDVITGKTPMTSKPEYFDGDIIFITPSDIVNGYRIDASVRHISESGYKSIQTNTLSGISVLIGCIGSDMGNVALVQERCATNQQINAITNFCENVNPFYVYYLLSMKKKYFQKMAGVTTTPILPKTVLEDIDILLPAKSNQDRVASLLCSIDEKIVLNMKVCSQLEAMAKTLYDYWFVQFDFPDKNGRPYRTFGGEMVWNAQLKREIPKEWEVKCITEVFDVCYGYPFDTNKFIEEDIGNPVIRIRDILETTVSARTIEAVDEKYWVHSGDLIVGMDGNFHMNFWNGAPALLNQRCFKVSHKEDSVMVAYFSSMPYIKAREKNVTRTTVGHLGADDVKSLYVAYPAETKKRKYIASAFDRILDMMCLAREENRELSKLRDWLLPMLMNGQARVE